MSLSNKARVILVGNGRMGQIRSRLMYANPRFQICGIVDTNLEAVTPLADCYSIKPFNSITEAISYNEKNNQDNNMAPIDGVIISTPTFTHEKLIQESANHGLSIFTEKPVDETANKINYLFDYCQERNSKLCCSFQRRFDESYVATKEAIFNGAIGKPLTSRIFFGDHPSPPPEFLLSGGNIFMDLSAHDIDYIRWCLNDDIESVYAVGSSSNETLKKAGIHDNATLLLNFKKGAVVTIFLSRSSSYGYDQRCEIFGEGGLLKIENEHCHNSTLSNSGGVHLANLKYSFPQRFEKAFAAELDAFADTILLDSAWPITREDCIAVQKVADAANLSCAYNEVIDLDLLHEYENKEEKVVSL